jgi:DNA segregation ATPase FtsK/SpoIIIE-like protein
VKIAAIDVAKPASLDQIPRSLLWDAAGRPAEAKKLLAKIVQEMNARQGRKLQKFDLVLLIDELAALLQQRPELRDDLDHLAKVAREARIHLILVSQTPEDIPPTTLQQLHCRAIFRLTSPRASKLAVGNHDAADLRTGELLLRLRAPDEFELLRAPRVKSAKPRARLAARRP